MLAFVLSCISFGFIAYAYPLERQRRRTPLLAALTCGGAALGALPPVTMVAKLVGALAMPTGLLWLLLGGIPFLAAAQRQWRRTAASTIFWLGLTLAGNSWLGAAWLGWLEAPYEEIDPFANHYDAVFVLGGGAETGPVGRAQLGGAGDRVVLAAQLYHAGRTPILVSSGSQVPGANAVDDLASATADIWVRLGVPPAAIRQIPGPYDTRSEVSAYSTLTRELEWEQIGLVSSAWHLGRVEMHAAAAGLEATPLPADFRGDPSWEGVVSIPPSGAGFRLIQLAAWEILGRMTRQ